MQSLQKKVPQHFELMNQRKGFVRYMSPDLRALVKQHADALDNKEAALSAILQVTLFIHPTIRTTQRSLGHLLAAAVLSGHLWPAHLAALLLASKEGNAFNRHDLCCYVPMVVEGMVS